MIQCNPLYRSCVTTNMRRRDHKHNVAQRRAKSVPDAYQALPLIALYSHEIEAIIEGVQEDPDYDQWLEDFDKLFFRKGGFTFCKKGGDGSDSIYFTFNVKDKDISFKVMDKDGEEFLSFTYGLEYEEADAVQIKFADADKVLENEIGFDVFRLSDEYSKMSAETHQSAIEAEKDDRDHLNTLYLKVQGLIKQTELLKSAILPGNATPAENSILNQSIDACFEAKRAYDEQLKKVQGMTGYRCKVLVGMIISYQCHLIANIWLYTMFYFHLRPANYIESGKVLESEGYKRYNPDYNPVKRLGASMVYRAKNGTRSYFEQARQRRTESWHVRGHQRTYKKTGLQIWVNPYVKGTGENMRLSVYAEEAGRASIETV